MNNITFANPYAFYLLILIPLLIAHYIWRYKKSFSTLNVSTFQGLEKAKPTLKLRFRHLPFVLRVAALVFFIITLARPQSSTSNKEFKTEGVDIVLALDISGSMTAEDLQPNRIEAAKKTALQFIEERNDDRIGLVVFSGKSFTQCPVTIDHEVLKNLFEGIKTGMIEDGTAIGLGLATSIDRLKDSKAISKVIILLTDGINNRGISPLTASDLAKTFNIRVYTIGVGTKGKAPIPVKTPFGSQYVYEDVKIDEDMLTKIADATNGKYFRATSNKSLEKIYEEINKLEKTKIDEMIFSKKYEEFLPFALAGLGLILLEVFLNLFVFRKIP